MLNFLQDNLTIVTLLCLTVVALLLLALVLWASLRHKGDAPSAGAAVPQRMNLDSLKQSFRRAVELIEANIVARSERYSIPWVLVINEKSGSTELPLVQAGIQSALSTDVSLSAAAQGINWNFFDRGIAVQLQGDFLGPADGESEDNRTWDEFLGLCRDYRPDRPFDSVVVSLPASLLLRDDPQSMLEITARAKSIHRRLWLAQNRFALRFPIYIVVAGCEEIPGFARFAAALPEELRSTMLGWSTPYDLAAPYQAQWVDMAMNAVVSGLSDGCSEMCALELPGRDGTEYFLLPAHVERLRSGLRLFSDELMRPSAYHEPFVLRGFYLTGDCSEAAELLAGGSEDRPDPTIDAPWLAALPVAEDRRRDSRLAMHPAFLRDIFERKIFAEAGLVRPTSAQRMQRPVLARTLGWVAAGLLGGWTIGLVFSTVRLSHDFGALFDVIQRLDRHSAQAAEARAAGRESREEVRARAVDALALLAEVDTASLRSVFMPGSLPWFDTIQERVERRMERRFAQNDFAPMRDSLYYVAFELTGVVRDPGTLVPIKGAQCNLPAGWPIEARPVWAGSLSPESLPEFVATLQYLAAAERLDQALRAETRLAEGGDAPEAADMRTLVRVVLGSELKGNAERAAVLFRRFSQGQPRPQVEALQAALACSFLLANDALDQRLFDNNPLVAAERQLAEQLAQLSSGGLARQDADQALEGLRALLAQLDGMQKLFKPGAGDWMARGTLDIGQAWESMMQRAAALGVLGAVPVAEARRRAEASFVRFQDDWNAAGLGDPSGGGGGLVWQPKEKTWSLSQDRIALQGAIAALMAQPFITANRRSNFPVETLQAAVGWDRPRLDQALALEETRTKFRSDVLPRVPRAQRSAVESVANAVLADTLIEMITVAMQPGQTAGGLPPVVGEPERTRLTRLQALLLDLGGRAAADRLGDMMAGDANARLRLVDEALVQGEFYLPRERDFRSWTGNRAPLLQAFAVNDPLALASYAAEQFARIEKLAREAEVLLPSLDAERRTGFLAQRWQAIVTDLARYKARSPSSNLLALEQFVLAEAAEIDGTSCGEKLVARASMRRVPDIFSERLKLLRDGLLQRCQEIASGERQALWEALASSFNRDLAGRSPFVMPGASVTATAGGPNRGQSKRAGAGRASVDPEEILPVLRLFERAHKSLLDRSIDAGLSRQPMIAIRRFDEQMERVRAFLAPLYPADENAAAGYDLSIDFRANADNEVEGNQIIEWALVVDSQTLRQRDPVRALRWEPGMPVTLSLRFARNGRVLPQTDAAQPWMTVDDRTVNYRFADLWSLLSLLQVHRDTDGSPRGDQRMQLLKFEFPISTVNENPKLPPVESSARVYVRLGISPAGKRSPLVWPGTFPVSAPTWEAQ